MKIISFVIKLALALALVVVLLGIAMYFAGYDFYARVNDTTIFDSAGGFKMSSTEALTVKIGYAMSTGDDESIKGYSVMVVPNTIAGKDFTYIAGGTSYSYQAEKDLTAGFNIVYGENEFKIYPKGDLKKVLESVRSNQGNVEVDMSKCYSNMYTLIVYSHDGEDFVKIHFTNLDDGVKNDNPGTTDSSTTDSSTNNGGTTDSSSNNNNSNNDTGGNSGGSSGGNSGGNSSGSSTKPWPPPGGYDII